MRFTSWLKKNTRCANTGTPQTHQTNSNPPYLEFTPQFRRGECRHTPRTDGRSRVLRDALDVLTQSTIHADMLFLFTNSIMIMYLVVQYTRYILRSMYLGFVRLTLCGPPPVAARVHPTSPARRVPWICIACGFRPYYCSTTTRLNDRFVKPFESDISCLNRKKTREKRRQLVGVFW